MQRFFLDTNILWNNEIILNDEEIIFQLTKVLRSVSWDKVIFFNWVDLIDYLYVIWSIDKRNIIFNFEDKILKSKEEKNLILFQSLPNKIDKIEEVISKWTEIWYKEFNFFRADRSQDLRLSENKIERFKKIIKEASEQSNRNIIPKLNLLDKLDILNISWEKIFFHTDVMKSIKINDLNLDSSKNINIFIWPEWGFSDKENKIFEDNNFIKVNLWNNVLRTENAPIVVWFFLLQK